MIGMSSTVGIEVGRFGRALYVARNMRPADKLEIYNLMPVADPAMLAAAAVSAEFNWVATKDQEPVCVFGAKELWRGVWGVHLFATERFPEVAVTVLKHCCGPMQEALRACGVHRLQCYSQATHVDAHAFLERCGATREAAIPCFGRDGSDYYLYGWTDQGCRPLGKEVRDVYGG